MPSKRLLKILFVEDLPSDAELAILELRKAGLRFEEMVVDTRDEFIRALREFSPDIVISDYMMPSYNGLKALVDAREFDPEIPFILYTGSMNEEIAVESLKAGADDYIIKDHPARLPFAVNEVLEMKLKEKEKRAGELLLKESEEKLQSIFSAAPVGIGLTVNRILMEVNDTFCKMTGYARTELIGKSSEMVYVTNEEYESVGVEKYRQIKKKGTGSVETRFRCKDGRILNVNLSSAPLDKHDLLKGVTFTVLDITERVRAEEALNWEKSLVYSLMSTLPDRIYFKDLNSRFIRINKAQANAFNLEEPCHAIGKTDSDFFTGEHAMQAFEDEQKIIRTGQSINLEERETHRDRSDTWVATVKMPLLDREGDIIGTFGISRDITERKLAEAALNESEERFRNLYNDAVAGLYRTNPQGEILLANNTLVKMLGFSSFEELSERNLKLTGYEPVLKRQQFADQIEKEGEVKDMESVWVCRDGKEIFVRESAKAIYDSEGKILYYDGTVVDITEQKNTDRALSKIQHLFETLALVSPVGIFRTDADGNTTYVNPTWSELSGLSPEEGFGVGWLKIIHPEDRKQLSEAWSNNLSHKKESSAEYRLIRPDGKVIWVMGRAVPELIGNELIGYVGTITDITELKKVEEILRESEEKFRSTMENSADAIFITDQKGKYQYVNKAAAEMLGFTSEELLSKTILEITPPDKTESSLEIFNQVLSEGKVYAEIYLQRKDGSYVTVDLNSVLLPGGMVYGSCRDITERKQVQEELKKYHEHLEELVYERTKEFNKAKKEAEEANKAKSEFLANMSHEIRTPMNAVLGYSELLSSTTVDQTQENYINSIKSSGRSLLTLINDILDLSKIEAGKLDLKYDYVDTCFFFTEFERIFSHKVDEKGLKLILDISAGTPAGIKIDEARVRQIVFNLIGNAIKFTSEGKIVLKVFTENPQIVKYSEDEADELIDLIIEVQDTGIGITKALQEEIFKPFVQERAKEHHGGTGLGLTITRRLVSLMHGTITLQSKPGKGSTFRVRIPRIEYQRAFTRLDIDIKINPSEILFEKSSIIIADDTEHNRNYLRDALKTSGIKITDAEDGITAYKIAKEIVPDLIIADVLMPKTDGYWLLNKIKADQRLKHIPVIAYSASVLKDQKDRINKSDFAGLLVKPVKVTELYYELMRFLPYKSTRAGEHDESLPEVDLTGEISDRNGLIHSLETDLYSTWETFAVRQPIGEIREFGKNLIQLGMDHNSGLITGYGKELVTAADDFNIEAILNLRRKYTGLIECLRESA